MLLRDSVRRGPDGQRQHSSSSAIKLMKQSRYSIWWAMALFASAFVCSAATIQYAGVNLFGAEFSPQNLPGNYGSTYVYPNQAEVDYFRGKGMNIFRLPFRWERLQRTNNTALDATELSRMSSFVNATTAKGAYVILEPHNFARYYPDPNDFQGSAKGLVGSDVPYSAFSNFWNRVATVFKTNDHVFFNLCNEPANMPTEQWLTAANIAILGIRNTGATNLILVPGNGYTQAGAWFYSWYGTSNAAVMLGVVDPTNNYAYEVHQYFDDGSGTTADIRSATIGAERLGGFTQWLKDHNKKGFLGEFAVADTTIGAGIGDEAISNLLTHVKNNADVWLGWTWWAAGPMYTNYMFSLEPVGGGNRPQMAVLTNFIPSFAASGPIPAPTLESLTGNKIRFTAQSGFVYQFESSTNILGGPWINFGSPITGANQIVTNTLPVATSTQGALRVRVSRAP